MPQAPDLGFIALGLHPLSLFIKVITVELLGIPAAASQEAQLSVGREVVVVERATTRLFKGLTGLSLVSDRVTAWAKLGGLKRPSEVTKSPPFGRKRNKLLKKIMDNTFFKTSEGRTV